MGVCANKLSNCSLLDSSFVTNNIHFEHSTHRKRKHRLSKEDTLWNDIQFSHHPIVRGRLCDATTRRVLRKNRGYTLAKTEDRCSHVPLYVFLSQHAVNNTLLMMIVDSGTSTCGAIATIADTSPTTPTSSCSVWTSSRTP